MLMSLRDGEIPCRDNLDECMSNNVTHNCTMEARVMLVLFILLQYVTHHVFFEDYMLEELCLHMSSALSIYY